MLRFRFWAFSFSSLFCGVALALSLARSPRFPLYGARFFLPLHRSRALPLHVFCHTLFFSHRLPPPIRSSFLLLFTFASKICYNIFISFLSLVYVYRHEYPVPPRTAADDEVCSAQAVGKRFNAFNVNSNTSPPPGLGTNDQYEIGDLSGKYGELPESQDNDKFMGIFADFNLPLFGINSIAGRSIVIYSGDGSRWICANIGYPGPVHTAVATFRYPIVGHVIFRQVRKRASARDVMKKS